MDGAEGQRKIFASSEVSPLGTFERLATATQPAESNPLGNAREAQGTVKMGHSKGSVDREGAQTNLHARRHWFGWPQARGAMSNFSRPPTQALRDAYAEPDAERAKKMLGNLSRRLRDEHPGAAASLLEGLDETLTVKWLGLPAKLERQLSTTNAIENVIGCASSPTESSTGVMAA